MKAHLRRKARQRFEPQDVGTLWSLRREEYSARCILLSWSPDWELRVLIGSDILLAKRCRTTGDAFALGERWRRGLLDHGWTPITPMASPTSTSGQGERSPINVS